MILLVGAGRFERPTPCAQGRFRQTSKTAYFQLLSFQADVSSLLKLIDGFEFWLAPALPKISRICNLKLNRCSVPG